MLSPMRFWIGALIGLTAALQAEAEVIVRADWTGPIGPATVEYLEEAIAKAEAEKAPLLIVLDTPGGLLSSTQTIVRRMLEAKVPIVVWIPPGGRAASAGVFLVYAAHIAAAARSAHLGAATPVPLGMPTSPPNPSANKKEPKQSDPLARKATEDAVAFLRSLAKLRGRNASWAEDAVRKAAALDAPAAKAKHVIDLLADDLPSLLAAIDGRRVRIDQAEVQLATKGAHLIQHRRSLRNRLLGTLSDPNIAYLLLVLGFYGILFELLHPGGIVPGVLGAVFLLLGLYGLQTLPVDLTGILLMLLGLGLMAAEAFAPGFGVLGIAGIAAFVIGSMMLFSEKGPGYELSFALIVGAAGAGAALFGFALAAAIRLRRQRAQTGQEAIVGDLVVAEEDFADEGFVHYAGERWRAQTSKPIAKGEQARIVGIQGLTLQIEPMKSNEQGGH